MTDKEVAEKVAELWIELGCDAEGFKYAYSLILEEIERAESE